MLRSSFAVARISFAASFFALVFSGCAADTTAPADARMELAASMHRQTIPMRGSITATETGNFDPVGGVVRIILAGYGQATHVGRYTIALDIQLEPITATGAGTLVLTSADGSTLLASLTGVGIRLPNNIADITESAVITGGTGRFAGATGRFTIARILDQSTGISQGTIDGFLDK